MGREKIIFLMALLLAPLITGQLYDDCSIYGNCEEEKTTTVVSGDYAMVGDCPEGFAVQNTTTDGVECVSLTGGPVTETDPYWTDNFTKYNSSWSEDTDTTYTAGSNLTLIGEEFSLDTTSVLEWLEGIFLKITDYVTHSHDQDLNTTNNVTFNKHNSTWNTKQGNFNLEFTDDGNSATLMADVGGANYLEIATEGGFFELYANPNPSNGYLLASITETQGDDTNLNFYEGGTGHNRFWDSGSARFGGSEGYLCSEITSSVDCDTLGTGADVVIQDDTWTGGRYYTGEGIICDDSGNCYTLTELNRTDTETDPTYTAENSTIVRQGENATFNSINYTNDNTTFYLFEGDSITAGANSWADLLYMADAKVDKAGRLNVAKNGDLTADVLSNYSTNISAFKRTRDDEDYYLIILIGSNDIKGGVSAETTYDNLKTIWNLSREDGYKVIASTIPPQNESWINTPEEKANWTNLNNYILSNPRLYDGLMRPDLVLPDANDSYWYSDGLHPTLQGQIVLAYETRRALMRGSPHNNQSLNTNDNVTFNNQELTGTLNVDGATTTTGITNTGTLSNTGLLNNVGNAQVFGTLAQAVSGVSWLMYARNDIYPGSIYAGLYSPVIKGNSAFGVGMIETGLYLNDWVDNQTELFFVDPTNALAGGSIFYNGNTDTMQFNRFGGIGNLNYQNWKTNFTSGDFTVMGNSYFDRLSTFSKGIEVNKVSSTDKATFNLEVNATDVVYADRLVLGQHNESVNSSLNISSGDIVGDNAYFNSYQGRSIIPLIDPNDFTGVFIIPKYEAFVWFEAYEGWDVHTIKYNSTEYTKQEFNQQYCQRNNKTLDLCSKMNDKIKTMQSDYVRNAEIKAKREACNYHWDGTSCSREVRTTVTYEQATEEYEEAILTWANVTKTELGDNAIPITVTREERIESNETITKKKLKDNCYWNSNEGYYCITKQEVVL